MGPKTKGPEQLEVYDIILSLGPCKQWQEMKRCIYIYNIPELIRESIIYIYMLLAMKLFHMLSAIIFTITPCGAFHTGF